MGGPTPASNRRRVRNRIRCRSPTTTRGRSNSAVCAPIRRWPLCPIRRRTVPFLRRSFGAPAAPISVRITLVLRGSDVLNDIDNMLADLTYELDSMLEEESNQLLKQKS